MNKVLLKQALLFKNELPRHSKIKKIYELAKRYEDEHTLLVIDSRVGKKAEIVNSNAFFEFLSDEIGFTITSFEQIERILNVESRAEQSRETGNTKTRYIEVFDKTVIFQIKNNNPMICKEYPHVGSNVILAVENGETFLDIYSKMAKFGFEYFVYLGGYSNIATRKFLEDKNVVFYLDYDIEAMRIFKSFNCKSKDFFLHPRVEEYFKSTKSNELYLKQRKNMPEKESIEKELLPLWNLIDKYSTVVEQEEIS